LAVGLVMSVVAVLFVVCAVVLVLVILIQKGRGGGLSAAFGGGMASGILGSKTGDFLTWVTIVAVGVFLMLAVVMAKFYKPTLTDFGEGPGQRPVRQEQRQPAPPEETSQPQPAIETGETTPGDVNTGADTTSAGVR